MNNFIIVIFIIIILFLFSADKEIINQSINYKSILLLIIVYFIYNNINLLFLIIVFIIFIISNQRIRNILYNKYENYIDIGKKKFKIFLDINKENNEKHYNFDINENLNINNDKNKDNDENIQELIDEIKISE
jgi:hypothetical protein